ncbi:MAG TPA: 6-hydroxymethylpterin diphosphokinase MptE-like protein [Nitrosopumilaceae archaeon]|nr:6-hydroxymethylpterin diphosphokinase MptE-like protein [Nitrosopumilaceae archaeon]
MAIAGWEKKYNEIIKEFGYDKQQDHESAILLDLIIKNPVQLKKIRKIISKRSVFVIGAGPSLSTSIQYLKKYSKIPKIVADSATKPLLENKIKIDIVVTDLDGDEKAIKKIGKSNSIMVTHAHGDNIAKLQIVENFKNCLGTTQAKPFGKIQNFGGFTDGDRGVFLAHYFGAKNIILIGMDFGKVIGKCSKTKKSERKIKLKKLNRGKKLLEWLATKRRSGLYTTSKSIRGFKKISFKEIEAL